MTSFRRAFRVALRVGMVVTLTAVVGGTIVGWRAYRRFASDLPPRLDVVTDYRPLRASQVFSADGELIGQFYVEKRVLVPVEQIPKVVKQAFVAAEDARFYSHGGIDYFGIVRAAWANFRAGHVVQGGSTITQQVAKLLIVGQEKSLARKAREAMLAHRIEAHLSKDQILGIYLNHVYLGHGAYGVAAAAAAYFGKEAKDLSAAEAAMLAGLPKAPGRATPFHDFVRAQARQRYVIDQMQSLGFLTREKAETARREPLVIVARNRSLTNVAAPYFVETIRRYVADNYGDEELLERGLRIYTTLDMRKQRAAEAAVRNGLQDLERRLGWDGPIGHLDGEQRRRLQSGRPRPFGPAGFVPEGFLINDAEQDDYLLMPGAETAGAQPGDPHAAMIDATKPGAHLPEPVAKYVVSETYAAERKARAEARKRAAAKPAAPEPFVDPATTYAAMVTVSGNGIKHVTVSSGTLTVPLDPADEARLLAWESKSTRIATGDIVPVQFRQLPGPRSDARGAAGARGTAAGDHHLVATLASAPSVQGALIAIDPSTGELVSMVGGYDYAQSQFNRARQAHRQIGSAMKPFIYASAIDRGMTELTIK